MTEQPQNVILDTKKIRLLIADASPSLGTILETMLRKLGFLKIDLVNSGASALEKLEAGKVDLIFCDQELPGFSADKLLEIVKTIDSFQHLPFVVIAPRGENGEPDQSLSRESDAYITRPYSFPQLRDVLMRTINFADQEAKIPDTQLGKRSVEIDQNHPREDLKQDSVIKQKTSEFLSSPSTDYGRMSVLLVDSDISSRSVSREILEGLGFQQILLADSAVGAMQILETETLDLIVCEWLICGGKGLSLLKRIRGDQDTYRIPFVMLSQDSEKEDIVSALRFRANDYLIKPATEELLSSSLERIFAYQKTTSDEEPSEAVVINEREITETASALVYSAMSVDTSYQRKLDDVTVLLLDNDEKSRRATNCMLKRMGFSQVIESAIAASAEKKLREGKIDIVFTEWNISEDSASEIFQAAKLDKTIKKIPIVILSSSSDKECVLAALREGASDYLEKPCRLKELAQSAARVLPVTGKVISLYHS